MSSSSLRKAARVAGSLLAAGWTLVLVGGIFGDDEHSTGNGEGIVLALLGLAALVGLVVAFRRSRPGGLLLLAIGLALCVFAVVTAGRNHWLAVLVSGVPWMLVGGLFLLSSGDRWSGK